MIGLDTNVLLRWIIDETVWPEDSRDQVRAVSELIDNERQAFFVNHVVLAEAIWVLGQPMRQPKPVLLDVLDRLLLAANVVVDRREVVVNAVAEFRTGKAGFTDHLIGQANRHAGCETTVSFDKGAGRSAAFRLLRPRGDR